MKRVLIAVLMVLCLVCLASAEGGVRKKRQRPFEFGMVIIDNFSTKGGMAPVVFDHWRHRSKFTCRLCHVDIAITMKAGATKIKAVNNTKGFYCGTCHNGKMQYDGKTVFAACAINVSPEEAKRCEKCHPSEFTSQMEADFWAFSANLPKERLGNGINWEKAEEMGLIKPIDFLEGISKKRQVRKTEKDFSLGSKVKGLPDIIFSHKKHTVWNGCDVCHPEIFVGVKKGATKYSMIEIFDGRYCGTCHLNVAFPLTDCQRCHTKPTSMSTAAN